MTYGGNVILRQVSCCIEPGTAVLLEGANGAGKTTLLNILQGALMPDSGSIILRTDGRKLCLSFPKPPIERLFRPNRTSIEQLAACGIGRLWQNLRLFQSLSSVENVAVAQHNNPGENPVKTACFPGYVRNKDQEVLSRARKLLQELGLVTEKASSPHQLSSGEAKRLAVALAGHWLFLLDEPFSSLDTEGVGQVIDLLLDLSRKTNLAMIIVEHAQNVPLILPVVNKVWTLRNSQLIERCPTDLNHSMMQGIIQGLPGWVRNIVGEDPSVSTQHLPGSASLVTLIPKNNQSNQSILEVDDVIVRRGQRTVIGWPHGDHQINGLSFRLQRGSVTVLAAPNGWGKSTLVDALIGNLQITKGTINLAGIPMKNNPTWIRRRAGLCVVRSMKNSFNSLTVRETLRLHRINSISANVNPFLDRKVGSLSGGERQMLVLEAVLRGSNHKVIILDEPAQSLDQDAIQTMSRCFSDMLPEIALFIALPKMVSISKPA